MGREIRRRFSDSKKEMAKEGDWLEEGHGAVIAHRASEQKQDGS